MPSSEGVNSVRGEEEKHKGLEHKGLEDWGLKKNGTKNRQAGEGQDEEAWNKGSRT
ncbi:MAG: hypothetical protein BMS9Abin10_0673 [Gammaproteobacteria bacterium]|nr:MAG: hypothetical protein BMS9Abin10_0673 [Gammaproteobacteria bacterium]